MMNKLKGFLMLLIRCVISLIATVALLSLVSGLIPATGYAADDIINGIAALFVYNLIYFYLFTRKALIARIAKDVRIYFRHRILYEGAALAAILFAYCLLVLLVGDAAYFTRNLALCLIVPLAGGGGFLGINYLLCRVVWDTVGK